MMSNVKQFIGTRQLPQPLLRVGLAFVFLYAAIASLTQPLVWSGFLPSFLVKAIDPAVSLRAIAAFEIILSGWLLSGQYRKCAAAVAALTLAGITLTNMNQFIVTFRDIGLLCAAMALFFIEN